MLRSRDLPDLGVTRGQMAARVRRGEATLVRPGVWSLEATATPEERHAELIAATWPGLRVGAVVSHASAAVLHGLPAPVTSLAQVHITRPGRSGKRTRLLHTHRDELAADDITTLGGVPVTTLARTVLDCGRLLDPMDGLAVTDAALRAGLRREPLLERLTSEAPRRGSARGRAVLRHADALAESAGESWSRWRMIELGIPLPRLQSVLLDAHGDEVARCDFDWEEHGLVGEFDGAVKYGRLLAPGQDVADVILAEKAREERIRRVGRWVIRWTAADLFPAARFRALIGDAWRLGRAA